MVATVDSLYACTFWRCVNWQTLFLKWFFNRKDIEVGLSSQLLCHTMEQKRTIMTRRIPYQREWRIMYEALCYWKVCNIYNDARTTSFRLSLQHDDIHVQLYMYNQNRGSMMSIISKEAPFNSLHEPFWKSYDYQ